MDTKKPTKQTCRLQCNANGTSCFLPYKDQNYEQLKKECLEKKTLFEDPLFRTIDSTISYTRAPPYGTKWKRPFEIVKKPVEPVFIKDEAHFDDLDQGQLGDCWFIAACSAVATIPKLFDRVCPSDQAMSGPDYAGIYHFRFWISGSWYDVVIDDRLPVSAANELLFCQNKQQPNEFFGSLLEKAYAKVCLSYENLDGGFTTDGLIDMTGGIQESFQIKTMQTQAEKKQMWQNLIKSRQHESLIGASIAPNPRIREARLYNGLVMGHAYTITKVACVERYGREIQLIQVRNPWGNEVEWRGAWSDTSYDWLSVSPELQKALGYKKLADGCFWMSFDDFYKNFETLDFCSLTPDAFSSELDNKTKLAWKLVSYHGEWVKNQTAGGCGKPNERSFWMNPQFLVTLTDADPNDNENLATIIISLLQKGTKEKRMRSKGEPAEEFVQFRFYRILKDSDAEEAKKTNVRLYANQLVRISTSGSYINLRDVTKRFRVTPGNYMIIPSCYDEGAEGQFLIRLFTENRLDEKNVKILDDHKDCLTDTDVFFSHAKSVDGLFNNWNNLVGGGDDTDSSLRKTDSEITRSVNMDVPLILTETETPETYMKIKATKTVKYRSTKEACTLM